MRGRIIFGWAFEASNASLTSGWSFWTGAAGFFLSVIGFTVTLVQLGLTKKAATAAADAANQARLRVAGYELASELSRALAALSSTRDGIKRQDWPSVVEHYAEARISLTKIAALPSAVSADARAELSRVVEQIEKSARRIAAALAKGEGTLDRMKILHAHADYEVAVTAVSATIDRTQ
ncbi:hypothetical protein [Brevundimonas sp. Leaf363]|uniref:hypothetical protein n=1 Tax=Brevundimonas sp. Leaf363 TaxID=1736353 RepID=UPI0012E0F620|nr:hypothetical protein [Brevundimonas sp. Leaf363]